MLRCMGVPQSSFEEREIRVYKPGQPSEFTPQTSQAPRTSAGGGVFDAQVGVVSGDAAVGAAFATLPFDHLLFTGSTPVGRALMRAASEKGMPVTLEFGGKSPVIILPAGLTIVAREHCLRQARQCRPDLHRSGLRNGPPGR